MRDLFICCAGGLGREAAWTVERINRASQQPLWNLIGFADDDPAKARGNFEGYPMLGSCEQASKDYPGASVFVAIGDNRAREAIYRRLRGHDFPALIELLSKGKAMGRGDVYLMAACGLFLGVKGAVVAIFIGLITGSVAGLIQKHKSGDSVFAFGPWLSVGIAIAAIWGQELGNLYLSTVIGAGNQM